MTARRPDLHRDVSVDEEAPQGHGVHLHAGTRHFAQRLVERRGVTVNLLNQAGRHQHVARLAQILLGDADVKGSHGPGHDGGRRDARAGMGQAAAVHDDVLRPELRAADARVPQGLHDPRGQLSVAHDGQIDFLLAHAVPLPPTIRHEHHSPHGATWDSQQADRSAGMRAPAGGQVGRSVHVAESEHGISVAL